MDTLKSMYTSMKPILTPYFISNILLSVSYLILKTLYPVCAFLFDDCYLDLVSFKVKDHGMSKSKCHTEHDPSR